MLLSLHVASLTCFVGRYRDANADLNGDLGGAGVASMFAAAKQFAADNDDAVPPSGDGNGGDGAAGSAGGTADDDAESKKGAMDDEAQQAAWDKELEELMTQLEQMEVDRLEANRLGEEMKISIKVTTSTATAMKRRRSLGAWHRHAAESPCCACLIAWSVVWLFEDDEHWPAG